MTARRPATIATGVRQSRSVERDARQSGSEDTVGESDTLNVNVNGGNM
jgi:hypothetical protein